MRKWLAIGTVSVAAGLSLIPISVAVASPAAKRTGPSITHFQVSPKNFGSRGGVLHYSADLQGTNTYTLRLIPEIAGFPRTLKAHPHVAGTIRIPANRSASMRVYSLALGTYDGVNKHVKLDVRSAPVNNHPFPVTTTTVPAPVTTTTVPAPAPTTTTTAPAPTTTTTTLPTPPPTTTLPTPPTTGVTIPLPPPTTLPATPVLTLNYTGNPGTDGGNPEFGPAGGTLVLSGGVDDSGAPAGTYVSCKITEPSGMTDYLNSSGLTCSFSGVDISIPASTSPYNRYYYITLTATAYNGTSTDTVNKGLEVEQLVPSP
jgi:hypothetical protein